MFQKQKTISSRLVNSLKSKAVNLLLLKSNIFNFGKLNKFMLLILFSGQFKVIISGKLLIFKLVNLLPVKSK